MPRLTNDPIADLVKPQKPVDQTSQVVFVKPEPSQFGNKLGTFIVFVLAIVLAFLIGAKYFGGDRDHKQDDHHEQKDDKKQDDKKDQGQQLAKGSWLLFIEETEDRTKYPYLALIQADKAWTDGIQAKGIEVSWYDDDAKEIAKWRADAEKAGLPALVVIDPKGKVLKSKTVPETTQAIDEFVFGGAK